MTNNDGARGGQAGCGCALLLAASLSALVVLFGQVAVWLGGQFAALQGAQPAGWPIAVGSLAIAGLAALPVGALWPALRDPAARAVLRSWLLACAVAAAFAPLRALPPNWTQTAMLAQAVVALALTAAAAALRRRRAAHGAPAERPRPDSSTLLVAAALGVAVALPWLRLGALGSAVDTLLALLAGMSLGALMAVLLDDALLRPLREPALPARGTGFAAAIALLIAAGGFGVGGAQLLLMVCLPPLGLAAAAFARSSPGAARLPVAVAVGIATAAPLALVDPDEISLLLLPGDVPELAAQAALLSLVLGLVLGGILLISRRGARPAAPIFGAGALVLALALAAVAYTGGQPGTHGDRLFVILREQPDPRALVGGAGATREERLAALYRGLVGHADRTQAQLRADLERRGVAYTPYYLMNALEVHADDPWLRADLASRPEVERVLDSPWLRPLPAPPTPWPSDEPAPDAPDWNITAIGADRVWRELNITGAGIVIGQSDSGVDWQHPALREGYRGRGGDHDYNWLDLWSRSGAPQDLSGHGTHTLGSALGRGGVGVAPGAEWVGCVVLERNLGSPARYLDCLQFMLAPYPQNGDPLRDGDPARAPHILNNSWGCPPEEGCDPGALQPAVEALRAGGLFVVASAGNEGPGCSTVAAPIALYDAAFSVGAIDRSGAVAPFSSRGPVTADGSGRAKPDIVAPGVDIRSTWPGGGYATSAGTSSAGPHVAGVVALMWSANPALIGDVERTEQILASTARPPSSGEIVCGGAQNLYGAGIVDAFAAVQAAMAAR